MAAQSTSASQAAPCPAGPAPAPGEPLSVGQKLLNTATSALQPFKPLHKICQHVRAFHCYAHDTTRQVRAHHFCSHVNDEMRQCLIYDGRESNARLIGVEYIISRRLYEGLPEEEKRYWHSHVYEVTSGQLAALGLPVAVMHLDASKLIDTYGKTWHFWQVDLGHELPMGPPQLMMSFTADGQLDPTLVHERDAMFNLSTTAIRDSRADWDRPTPHPAADHPWVSGKAWTTTMQLQEARFKPGGGPGAAESERGEESKPGQPLATQAATEDPTSLLGLSLGDTAS